MTVSQLVDAGVTLTEACSWYQENRNLPEIDISGEQVELFVKDRQDGSIAMATGSLEFCGRRLTFPVPGHLLTKLQDELEFGSEYVRFYEEEY